MSGLAAIFHQDGRPADSAAVESMLAAIPHRAHDGHWAQAFGSVALGYAKTTVTVEDLLDQQPLVSPRTRSSIVADVRLDNRDQLLSELGGSWSVTGSDSELILRAYEAWGTELAKHLLGDFAFILWDPRARRLVCARDAGGARPLFYRQIANTFSAASEIHQFFQEASAAIAPNEERIRDWLLPSHVYRNDQEQAQTFFDGVSLLPAGHVLVVDGSHQSLQRYWELSVPRELRYRKPQEYVQHFADVLVAALTARLRSVYPVAAALSGGLDSTSIVSLAHQLYEQGLAQNSGFVTYSMWFDEPECDESPFIRDVQSKYGFDARGYRPMGVVANFDPEPGGFLAGPMKSPGELDPILGMAGEAGARTLLTGHYGDNCFGAANRSFDSLLRRGRWGELLRQLQAYRDMSGDSLRRSLTLYGLLPLLPLGIQQQLSSLLVRRDFNRERASLVPEWIDAEIARELLARDLEQRLQAEQRRRFAGAEREQMFRSFYPPETLPVSGGSPVQVVRPFGDRRLHEFVLALPPEYLFQPHPYISGYTAGSKLILRRAMLGILPESVRTRPGKTHFSALVLDEIRRRWSDYASAFGPTGRSEVAERGYIDPKRFWQSLERMRSGEFGGEGLYVLRILNLETWLRTFRLPRRLQTTTRALTSGSLEQARHDAFMAPRPQMVGAPSSRGALVGAG